MCAFVREQQRLLHAGTIKASKAVVAAGKNESTCVDCCHLKDNALQERPLETLDALQLWKGVLVNAALEIGDKESAAERAIVSAATG